MIEPSTEATTKEGLEWEDGERNGSKGTVEKRAERAVIVGTA